MLAVVLRQGALAFGLSMALLGLALSLFSPWGPLWALGLWLAIPWIGVLTWTIRLTLRSQGSQTGGLVWWRAIWGEAWAVYRVFIWSMPWTWRASRAYHGAHDGARLPVLLIHGYCCNHRVWDHVFDGLRARGHTVTAISLEPLFCSIDDYAAQVQSAVDLLCASTGQRQVALVGHSMGGLVIRAWMRARGSGQAKVVITLGTPHQGTQITPHARLPNAKQMVWHSDWLAQLEAQTTDTERSLLRIALTPQDAIVFPQTAQTLPPLAAQEFPGLGHLQLCTDAAVFNWICQALDPTQA
jgi:hypothetical protein